MGRHGSIDDVIAALEATGNGLAMDLGIAMRPFSSAGPYGRFFQGEVSFELSAQLTVFELSDLSSREELRSVVLPAIRSKERRVGNEGVSTHRTGGDRYHKKKKP